jgi:hypothetical protein
LAVSISAAVASERAAQFIYRREFRARGEDLHARLRVFERET